MPELPRQVSPRSVNTNLANAFELLDPTPVPGLSAGISHFLKEMGLDKLDSFYQKGQTQFALPLGIISNAKFTEKTIPAGDREILKDEVRKKCDELYRKSNKSIVWVDTSGAVDLSKAAGSKIPIGAYATGKSAFEFSGQLRLRRLEPYESPSGVLPRGISFGNSIRVPYTAFLARAMPPGSEFEISGEGSLNLTFEVQAAFKTSSKKTLSLLAQKLPQADKILVKLIDSGSLEGSLGYKYRYDPRLSFGVMGQYILETLGFMRWTRQTSGFMEGKRQDSKRLIKQYVFDLSIPEQAQAYEDLFLRFSITKAEELAQKEIGNESETSYELNACTTIGGTPITLYHVSESEKFAYSSSVNYHESKSVYERISKWFSRFSIVWEWISLNDNKNKSSKSYCHLTFDSPYASDFFDVTDSLKIQMLSEAREILTNYPKTEFHADIFFTDTGVQNIQKSSFDEAFEAYLDKVPTAEIKRYGEIQNKWFFTRWFFWREISRLENQNTGLKEIKTQIVEAYAFAKKTQPFKGSLKRFSDMKSIVSLMKLAKPEETIIHELSLTGPGIHLSNPDEGKILHPTQEITGRLAAFV